MIWQKPFHYQPIMKSMNCDTSNTMYLLTCEDCGTHYVWETAYDIHIQMNLHRRSRTGCPHITERFNYMLQRPNNRGSSW